MGVDGVWGERVSRGWRVKRMILDSCVVVGIRGRAIRVGYGLRAIPQSTVSPALASAQQQCTPVNRIPALRTTVRWRESLAQRVWPIRTVWAVPVLVGLLSDRDSEVRCSAMKALTKLPSKCRCLVLVEQASTIVQRVDDPDGAVRFAAKGALNLLPDEALAEYREVRSFFACSTTRRARAFQTRTSLRY